MPFEPGTDTRGGTIERAAVENSLVETKGGGAGPVEGRPPGEGGEVVDGQRTR